MVEQVKPAICRGSIVFESACLDCDRCITEAKETVKKYRRTPANKILKKDLKLVNVSMMILQKKLSRTELQNLFGG
jgi:hypothetical protein